MILNSNEMKIYPLFFLTITLYLFTATGCREESQPGEFEKSTAFEEVPEWSKNVVWYQIFIERFRNGDPNNDPTAEDIIGNFSSYIPDNWTITPWTQDWYKPDSWFDELHGKKTLAGYPIEEFGHKAQLRRYGGDLQGVLDKMDYLVDLGITAVYFNPLNDAPSLHKYDPRHWRHIDRNLGPNPKEDADIIATETPNEPATWKFTHADQLFLKVIEIFHKHGIKVILDYSWNHTGKDFWALKDILEKGEESAFIDWYDIKSFDDPATPENEFEYKAWFGVPSLPEIKEDVEIDHSPIRAYEGNLFSETVRQHIFNVSKRWLDPNGDGDPSDGVDGFRLDVASEIGLEFWREYRQMVRATHPDAYLLGEVWWEEWPDKLLNPAPFLQGDVFDAVMNYRWYRATRHFFNESPQKIPVSEFVDSLQSFQASLRKQNTYAMMNLTASHDVPRFATSIFNKNKYKVGTNPYKGHDYKINKPDAATYEIMKLILAQQFTYIGSPHIWAGDEMGMWGGDDPNCRKPLIWKDLEFEPETHHQLDDFTRPKDEVKFNAEWFGYYQKLIKIRKENPVLAWGDLEFLIVDDQRELLAYSRFDENEEVIVVFNTHEETQQVEVPVKIGKTYSDVLNQTTLNQSNRVISIEMKPKSVVVLR